jgi:dipeptidyl aminopeptidase/acylaminoacyl peptidase
MKTKSLCFLILCMFAIIVSAQDKFDYPDVFQLEWISEPQISPDGQKIIYVRNFSDIMTDQVYSNIWIINSDGTENHPLTTGNHTDYSPRWSPDGNSLVYLSDKDKTFQIYRYWPQRGYETKLTNVNYTIGKIEWSPDGNYIAFDSFVEETPVSLVSLPSPPAGANWTAPPQYIDKFCYRFDGQGYTKSGNDQLFILSTEGGTPYQISDLHYGSPVDFCWSADGKSIYISASGLENGEFDRDNFGVFDIFEVRVKDKTLRRLTQRLGPDLSPAASPDGKLIAYTGFNDKFQAYQTLDLYVMNCDGSSQRQLIPSLDRDVENIRWSNDSKKIYFQYDDQGNTILASSDLNGNVVKLTENIGGLSLDRPYSGGTFTVSAKGTFAFTLGATDHPADLAYVETGSHTAKRLTNVNNDIFSYKPLGKVEEIWFSSSYDNRKIQGWLVYPPDYDPSRKYPLILEIHGGPTANYGSRYATEVQLYASHGYMVLYTNPRGSNSYGAEFGNLIHTNYPGQDYDDLMSGVDYVIKKGIIDENNLFVAGGSGGGTLSAWIIGHTNRFKAAVICKPIVNWVSFVLYGDEPDYWGKYMLNGFPWDQPERYLKLSPVSYVKNITTPAMLLSGEDDYRVPIAEIEQFFTALKMNKVETCMVRIKGAGHELTARPSNQISKVMYTLAWFDKYRK